MHFRAHVSLRWSALEKWNCLFVVYFFVVGNAWCLRAGSNGYMACSANSRYVSGPADTTSTLRGDRVFGERRRCVVIVWRSDMKTTNGFILRV